MTRLRPVFLGTETLSDGTARDRVVLVLDHLPPEQITSMRESLGRRAGLDALPPILAFPGAVDLGDGEAYALGEPEPEPGQERTILVVGADRDDAHALIQAFETASGEQCVSATPQTGLPYGMPYPAMVLYTAAFQALPAGKRHRLEEQVRVLTAKP